MEFGEKIYKLKAEDKATFYSLVETKSARNTEDRMFVVDSGASMHKLSKRDWSSAVQINENTRVFVHDLDLFVTVQLLDETLAVLSLRMFCSEHGRSFEWKIGETPQLTPNGKTITCTVDNLVPLVASSSSLSSISRSTDPSEYSRKLGTLSDPVTTTMHAGIRC